MNLEAFTHSIGHYIGGLLGQDFLSELEYVVIDFKGRKLRLYR